MTTTCCRITNVAAENRAPRVPGHVRCCRRLRSVLGVIVLIVCSGTAAAADEIAWRYDYNAARKEAVEKNRPLVLDFSTENCYYCAQLDRITFHDPAVAGLMNDKFIPLKVDAQKNALLTEALHIERFPTLVLAAPDGKILATIEGYRDPEPFHGHLQRALASVNNPEWMVRDYQEAGRAVAASEYSRAVALLKSIVEDGQERPIQGKARQMLQDLEQQAASRLAHARQLEDKGQNSDALDVLTDLLRAFPGTQAAGEGGQMLSVLALKPEVKAQQRTRRARDLLAQAKEDYRTQQYLGCMDRCEILASTYADLPEGTEAMQLVSEIKNNPDWMRQACDSLSERLGLMYMALAETWLKKGQPQQAAQCLERVIQSFPGSHQAEAAQIRLAQIQGQPTRQANFKKP